MQAIEVLGRDIRRPPELLSEFIVQRRVEKTAEAQTETTTFAARGSDRVVMLSIVAFMLLIAVTAWTFGFGVRRCRKDLLV